MNAEAACHEENAPLSKLKRSLVLRFSESLHTLHLKCGNS